MKKPTVELLEAEGVASVAPTGAELESSEVKEAEVSFMAEERRGKSGGGGGGSGFGMLFFGVGWVFFRETRGSSGLVYFIGWVVLQGNLEGWDQGRLTKKALSR